MYVFPAGSNNHRQLLPGCSRLYEYGITGKVKWAHLSTSHHHIKPGPLGKCFMAWRVLWSAHLAVIITGRYYRGRPDRETPKQFIMHIIAAANNADLVLGQGRRRGGQELIENVFFLDRNQIGVRAITDGIQWLSQRGFFSIGNIINCLSWLFLLHLRTYL